MYHKILLNKFPLLKNVKGKVTFPKATNYFVRTYSEIKNSTKEDIESEGKGTRKNEEIENRQEKNEENRQEKNEKNEEKIKYVKEGKAKYVFYTTVCSLAAATVFTYAYEKLILYRWNYQYDYYYNPNLKNVDKEKSSNKLDNKLDNKFDNKLDDKENNDIKNNNTDKVDLKKHSNKTKRDKPVVKNIILVRHGQYERRFKHDEELKYLTKEGIKQAEITGKKLKEILNNKKINVIYHSNIKRAIETAEVISKYFPNAKLINDENLNEGTPYLPDPLPKNSKFEAQKIKEDYKRINKAYETYFYKPKENEDDSYHLIICHGNVIRYFLCRALQLPLFAWLRFSSYNCGITWFVLDDEGSVCLREFGSVSHLPFESVTYY